MTTGMTRTTVMRRNSIFQSHSTCSFRRFRPWPRTSASSLGLLPHAPDHQVGGEVDEKVTTKRRIPRVKRAP